MGIIFSSRVGVNITLQTRSGFVMRLLLVVYYVGLCVGLVWVCGFETRISTFMYSSHRHLLEWNIAISYICLFSVGLTAGLIFR
jgi:hypothetical protein